MKCECGEAVECNVCLACASCDLPRQSLTAEEVQDLHDILWLWLDQGGEG